MPKAYTPTYHYTTLSTARHLSREQKSILRHCTGLSLDDLVAITQVARPLLTQALTFLRAHGLVALSIPERYQPLAQVVISVWNFHCSVCRYEWSIPENGWVLVPAKNARQLEAQAEQAVREQGGAVNLSGIYACPSGLAQQAHF